MVQVRSDDGGIAVHRNGVPEPIASVAIGSGELGRLAPLAGFRVPVEYVDRTGIKAIVAVGGHAVIPVGPGHHGITVDGHRNSELVPRRAVCCRELGRLSAAGPSGRWLGEDVDRTGIEHTGAVDVEIVQVGSYRNSIFVHRYGNPETRR